MQICKDNLTIETFEKYLLFLNVKNYSNNTKIRKKIVCRQYFKYLNKFHNFKLNTNIFKINQTYIEKSEILTQREVIFLFENIKNYKHRIILKILYFLGLRVSELCLIKFSDLDLHNNLVYINGKGSKISILYIDKYIKELFQLYIKSFHFKCVNQSNNFIFNNKNGSHISRNTIYKFIVKYSKLYLNKHITPHILRHTLASHLIENNTTIEEIREILGHHSIETTELYVHKNEGKLHRKFNKIFDKLLV